MSCRIILLAAAGRHNRAGTDGETALKPDRLIGPFQRRRWRIRPGFAVVQGDCLRAPPATAANPWGKHRPEYDA